MTDTLDTPWGRLRALRVAAGMRTAKELSHKTGIGHPTVTAHERGPDKGRGIRRPQAEKYAAAFTASGLPVTADWILFGSGEAPPPFSSRQARPAASEPSGVQDMPMLMTECVRQAAEQVQAALQEQRLTDTPENIALAIVELAADYTRERQATDTHEISIGGKVLPFRR